LHSLSEELRYLVLTGDLIKKNKGTRTNQAINDQIMLTLEILDTADTLGIVTTIGRDILTTSQAK
jgi:hypothetical protein